MDLVLLKVSRTACCSIEPGLINPSAVMTAIIKKCERVSECVHCNDGRVHVILLNDPEWGKQQQQQQQTLRLLKGHYHPEEKKKLFGVICSDWDFR